MAKKKTSFIKINAVKSYIKEEKKMRSSIGAIKQLLKDFNAAIEATITYAGHLAKEDKRNTIMKQDITPALEKHLGKKHLTWQETTDQVLRQTAADLGKISKAINDHIEKQKQ